MTEMANSTIRTGDIPTAKKGRRFVVRVYRLRIAGLGIGFFCVASVLLQLHVSWRLLALLVLYGFVWPHLAYLIACRCRVPYRQEWNNLLIDAALGGFWVVAMQFNVLPSVLILTMLSMDNIAGGGARLFARGLAAHGAGALLGIALLGVGFEPQSNMATILACLPFLVLYPLALGWATYRISQELARRSRELERLSRTDGLTGLHNRRHWEALLAEEFQRCVAQRTTSSLLLLDLDHFKKINDGLGHAAGDHALAAFARLLQRNMREQDLIGRYGGEEFGIVLKDVALADARDMTSRLFQALRAAAQAQGSECPCTASGGLAEFDAAMNGYDAWLLAADSALYAAKREGRDRIVEWGRPADARESRRAVQAAQPV